MSTATAGAEAAPPAKGKKKLIVIVAAALAVLLGGGGAAMVMLKKQPDAEHEAEDGAHAKPKAAAAKREPGAVPVFVPLDPFTVNLADREAERYAQIGITLEIDDAKLGEQIKQYMPAIRNNILMAIADRSAGELMDRGGKARLAERVRLETARALGYEVPDEGDEDTAGDDAAEDKPAKAKGKKKGRKKPDAAALPIRAVHFSNFIIQ